jgi:hypothetical protein
VHLDAAGEPARDIGRELQRLEDARDVGAERRGIRVALCGDGIQFILAPLRPVP